MELGHILAGVADPQSAWGVAQGFNLGLVRHHGILADFDILFHHIAGILAIVDLVPLAGKVQQGHFLAFGKGLKGLGFRVRFLAQNDFGI